ncbi:hypothetical protein ASPNIDRAFT_178313 [Aspergillus niger ATCC 1015]|uniref:Major facilitator superfamily (MFS) profile domain-containing protein n=1 Tax=Aspergillus niger (strain ATCC 1015 / CBS 113.46 / FGSC A1144 / LSHB Ac4 / NCTC 3858a / NRRL 328 / USDA 3528.7) TaxID=380704 RepID=G3YCJ1_ASPNA|nr:hypothetical protein ASPNIDRAFT_178313 [Aspergillus niger ATCC 1015]
MAVTASGPDPLDTNVDERTPLNSSAQHATPSANTPDYSSITKGLTSDVHSSHGNDEERPLISPPESPGNDVKALTSISTVIGVLLLGMSRLLRVHLQRRHNTSHGGNRQNIFRIQSTARCNGIGRDMATVILGRAISGIGGAGTMAMGSIIITDIVPRRDVAHWRAYINIAMTLGRSAGGPIGGWLTDTIGWRWSFIIQGPLAAVAALLVIWKLKLANPVTEKSIRRVDFLGTFLLAVGIVTITVIMDQAGQSFAWASLSTAILATLSLSAFVAFVLVELYVAPEPIFELRMLRKPNVTPSYLIGSLQITAQVGMMFSVPLYFQVTSKASATVAGGHLVPAVIGNTLGGLIAGAFIRRTGQFKVLLILAGLVASVAYLLLILRWNGHTGFWESLYIIPGGMGTGFCSAAAFVSMTAFLMPQEVAMATGGYFLLFSFAMTAGVTVTNSLLGTVFKRQMEQHLTGPGAKKYMKIIERALSDTSYINGLQGHVRDVVVKGYVTGLRYTYCKSFESCIHRPPY